MAELRVVATAGHVDHGKSSLIAGLTGIDPDRWAEEKRRGLTIDLGYAWCELPSGREVGFVDVPGHERFIANMLAGVGPVRLVLFVVAANEGWRRQSEEHLSILDVLGVAGGVVALTKIDLVDGAERDLVADEIRERLDGTGLEGAPIVQVSAATREGLDDLRDALDAVLAVAPAPEETRARLFVDRAFTIAGAGTVATGTLTGSCLAVADEIEVHPSGARTRIRSLQTHKRSEERACPVSRVAANLAGLSRDDVRRGDVLGPPGAWRATSVFEGTLRPVRALEHAITGRGAFKLYAGAAEVDARLRIFGDGRLGVGREAFVRITLLRPLVLDVFDRYVLRESGRMETVGGGTVLDVAPPRRAGPAPDARLARRAAAARDDLPAILADERGVVLRSEAAVLTGSAAGQPGAGEWLLRDGLLGSVAETLRERLREHHEAHPLAEGLPIGAARRAVATALAPVTAEPSLVEALLDRLVDDGLVERTAAAVRLPSRGSAPDERDPEVDRLLEALDGGHPTQPPSIAELVASGIDRDVLDAAGRAGLVVRVSPELVFLRSVVERAEAIVADARGGITVSAFREALGTTRKYAMPLLAWFDQRGLTRREGDLRFPRA
jgi:selenocysteine-specific elongation factor